MKQNKVNSGYCDYVLDQLSILEGISAKSMFGGFGIYYNGVIFAVIVDDTLYFKVDEVNKPDYLAINSKAFSYKTKSNKDVSMSYFEIPINILEAPEELSIWARKSVACSLRSTGKKIRKNY